MELDVQKVVVMTLPSHLESQDMEDRLFRVLSTCPTQAMLRFYSESPEEAAKEDKVLSMAIQLATCRGGVYRF